MKRAAASRPAAVDSAAKRVLLVGGGGREHALAWKLSTDDPSITLFAAPGNPGIAELARCIPIDITDIDGLLAFARREHVDLTVVGPEAPLSIGIVDQFRAAGLQIFGPTRAAAEIETSKAFSKKLMLDAGVPTARAAICTSVGPALDAIEAFGAPLVIKASGLAAGKGVMVCQTLADARAAVQAAMRDHAFGSAGDTILVEEFIEGEELSLFVLTDGENVMPLVATQDHKRLLEGDRGPNTGGMGAYAPVSIAEPDSDGFTTHLVQRIVDGLVRPTLSALRDQGRPFSGLLYAGLILSPTGPKVVEFNCRFGDPETEAVLPIIDLAPSLLDLMAAIARGERLPRDIELQPRGCAVTTVLASAGYPNAPRTGDVIELPPGPADVLVFHAGTRRTPDGRLVTAGGRVFAVTGLGATIEEAHRRSLDYASRVAYAGKQLRTDIGWREMARGARTS